MNLEILILLHEMEYYTPNIDMSYPPVLTKELGLKNYSQLHDWAIITFMFAKINYSCLEFGSPQKKQRITVLRVRKPFLFTFIKKDLDVFSCDFVKHLGNKNVMIKV